MSFGPGSLGGVRAPYFVYGPPIEILEIKLIRLQDLLCNSQNQGRSDLHGSKVAILAAHFVQLNVQTNKSAFSWGNHEASVRS